MGVCTFSSAKNCLAALALSWILMEWGKGGS